MLSKRLPATKYFYYHPWFKPADRIRNNILETVENKKAALIFYQDLSEDRRYDQLMEKQLSKIIKKLKHQLKIFMAMSLKKLSKHFFKKKILYFAFAYLIIFIIRTFFGLKHNSLSQDVARDLVLTERRIEQKQLFVAYGPKTSVGKFDLGPFYYQLHLWLSYLSGNHAYTMKFFTIALESFTPILVFLILKEFTSKKISLAAAGLYVFAGLPLIFGTSALNPNTIPFFTTLAFLGWIHYFKYHRKWGLMIGPLAVAITSNLHYQAVVLVPFLLLMFCYLLVKDRAQLKYLILGSFLGCLIYLPYFVAEISQGWPNTLAMINYFQTEHSQYYARVSKPAYVLTFIPSFLGRVLTHQNNPYRWLGRVIWFGGGVALSWQLLKAKQKRKKLWLLSAVYFGLILIMLRVYKGDKLDYYMSTLYLLPFILIAAISRASKLLAYRLDYCRYFFKRLASG